MLCRFNQVSIKLTEDDEIIILLCSSDLNKLNLMTDPPRNMLLALKVVKSDPKNLLVTLTKVHYKSEIHMASISIYWHLTNFDFSQSNHIRH